MIKTKYLNPVEFGKRNPFLILMAKVNSSSQSAGDKGQKFGRKNALPVEIDAEYLEKLYSEQMGMCPYYLTLGIEKKLDLHLLWKTYNFLTPSVDRIDSNKGYIPGNVVITFRGVNFMKSNIPYDEFMIQLKEFESMGNNTKIKRNDKVIKRLSNPNLIVMKYIKLLKVFVDAGELGYATKVVEQCEEIDSSEITKTKTKTKKVEVVVKNGELNTDSLKSKGGGKRKARRKFIKPRLQPWDESKNLVDVTEQYNWNSPDNIFARGDRFINGVSGSLYLSPNGTMSGGLYVDVDSIDEEFLVAS